LVSYDLLWAPNIRKGLCGSIRIIELLNIRPEVLSIRCSGHKGLESLSSRCPRARGALGAYLLGGLEQEGPQGIIR
jgi:hypothetical protein